MHGHRGMRGGYGIIHSILHFFGMSFLIGGAIIIGLYQDFEKNPAPYIEQAAMFAAIGLGVYLVASWSQGGRR